MLPFGALEVGTAAKLSFKVLGNFFKNVIPKNPFLTLEEYLAESLRQRNWVQANDCQSRLNKIGGELMEPVDETPITDPEVLLTARETDNLE
jgi:hypothetical protein